jgi:hypothetical protein
MSYWPYEFIGGIEEMILGTYTIGNVGELTFFAHLNSKGEMLLDETPDEKLQLTVSFGGPDNIGFGSLSWFFEKGAVPEVCHDVAGFFEFNKETLYQEALNLISRRN